MIRAGNLAFLFVSINILNFVTFSTYTGSGNTLTAKSVFTFIPLIVFASFYFVKYVVHFLLNSSEMLVATQRIQVNYCCHSSVLTADTTVETTITTRTW